MGSAGGSWAAAAAGNPGGRAPQRPGRVRGRDPSGLSARSPESVGSGGWASESGDIETGARGLRIGGCWVAVSVPPRSFPLGSSCPALPAGWLWVLTLERPLGKGAAQGARRLAGLRVGGPEACVAASALTPFIGVCSSSLVLTGPRGAPFPRPRARPGLKSETGANSCLTSCFCLFCPIWGIF